MKPISGLIEQQQNLFSWIQANRVPGKCKFCEYRHDGFHDYGSHLQEKHPEDYARWREWAGVKE